MIQTFTTQHQPLSQPFKIISEDERCNLQDLHQSEEEYLSGDDEFDLFQYDSEEEDFPTVFYNLPPSQKTGALQKERSLRQEKLKERNRQILQKKRDFKDQIHPLIFTETNPPLSLKKLKRLSRPREKVMFACYIPERNLLLAILSDFKTVNIYSTMNFNLIAVKKSQGTVTCISYSKHLEMIIVGGGKALLQLWNPKTFEIEAESIRNRSVGFCGVVYVPKAHLLVAKASSSLDIYNTGLRFLFSFSLPTYPGSWHSGAAQIHIISKHLLLASVCYQKPKGLFLLNLKTKKSKEFTKIFVPTASCVEHTENNPQHIFSCLAVTESHPSKDFAEWHQFNLTQFTVDPKTEEFSLVRKTLTTHRFSKLSRLENSKYLLAQKFTTEKGFEMFMLSINKDKVEIVNIISRPSSQIMLDKNGTYIMLKERLSSIAEVSEKSQINVYGCGSVTRKIEEKKSIENSEK